MNRYLTISLLSLAIAQATHAVAIADDAAATTTEHRSITFRDLNIQSGEGAAELYKRIERAADSMCSLSWDIRSLSGSTTLASEVGECKAQAIAGAVRKINAPMLTAVAKSKMHGNAEPTTLAKAR